MLKQRNESGITGKDLEAYQSIQPGMVLYGYCCGKFGRDSYGDKVVVRKTTDSLEVQEETRDGRRCTNWAEMRPDDWFDLVESSNSWLEEGR